jgi:CelD/BcsL family acetyltransferase involved in cellulose biosynthesis
MPGRREFEFLDPSDERWLAFATPKPGVNIFHHPAWMSLLAECYGYRPFCVVAYDADGQICAGIPMMEVNSAITGRRWVSLPFTDHCRPLYRDAADLTELVDALADSYQAHESPRTEMRWELPPHPAMQLARDWVLHTIPLGTDAQCVAQHMQDKKRRLVRAAEQKGVRIVQGASAECLDTFYRLHLLTRRRHGNPIQPLKFFKLLGKRIMEQGLGFVLLAYKDSVCLAGGAFLQWNNVLTYKYSASSGTDLQLRPNDLLLWTAIRWGCENGYTLLDMGRTDLKDNGLRQFKNRWGATETPLAYSTFSDRPTRPTSGRLTQVMETVIRNSPLWVCQAMGELLYKHVG